LFDKVERAAAGDCQPRGLRCGAHAAALPVRQTMTILTESNMPGAAWCGSVRHTCMFMMS
jgi:hypothetical protein